MGDTWQYRIRVSGPARTKWLAKATEGKWGSGGGDRPMYAWPMEGRFRDGKTYQAGGNWYNVTVRTAKAFIEFAGNFSGTPSNYFEKSSKLIDRFRSGPALFDGLDIKVEVVGQSWSCDCPTGIYSYREVFERGKLTKSEKSNSDKIAKRYAPELLEEFPDDYTPAERAEMAREALEERAEEKRRKAEQEARRAEQEVESRLTWLSLRPGALVQIHSKKASGSYVVERADGERAVFRYRLVGEDFDGATLTLRSDEDFTIKRTQVYCEHGQDRRTRSPCSECQGLERLVAQDVKFLLHGLIARDVL